MEKNQFTDLILLIGTNPLPNFVVAEFFLQQPESTLERIWLVYSKSTTQRQGTFELAKNVKTLLHERHAQVQLENVPLSNVSQADSILQDFQVSCLKNLPEHSSVHLNYTGGTKAMGIHIYRALEHPERHFAADIPQIAHTSFSYLDARTFQIIDDDYGALTHDLRQNRAVFLSFADMISLHGFHRVNTQVSNTQDAIFNPVLDAFTRIINAGQLPDFFNKHNGGYDRSLVRNPKRPQDLVGRTKQLDLGRLQQYSPNAVFQEVLEAFPEGYRLIKNGTLTNTKFTTNACCKRAVKFLDGFWFEAYLSEIIERRFPELNMESNWEIAKDGWRTKFELDIVLVKGYQLIGISCTTSGSKDRCKNKGFEILQRTRQIGGDEAKAILITCLAEDRDGDYLASIVEEELQVDTGNTGNILVLGIHDLTEETLVTKIREFIT